MANCKQLTPLPFKVLTQLWFHTNGSRQQYPAVDFYSSGNDLGGPRPCNDRGGPFLQKSTVTKYAMFEMRSTFTKRIKTRYDHRMHFTIEEKTKCITYGDT